MTTPASERNNQAIFSRNAQARSNALERLKYPCVTPQHKRFIIGQSEMGSITSTVVCLHELRRGEIK
jgi:hypothetical protein